MPFLPPNQQGQSIEGNTLFQSYLHINILSFQVRKKEKEK